MIKYVDFVLVLFLLDDGKVLDGIKSCCLRLSLCKIRGIVGDVMVDDFLKEFVDDEGLYMCEFKMLVDGVVLVFFI